MCAVLSAGLVLLLFGVCVLLTALTRDLAASFSGVLPVGALLFAALGLVIARRQPRNAIGWLLVASGLLSLLFSAAELYAVLAYRTHPGALQAGRVAVFAEAGSFLIAVLCGLAILLFPDGRLPSRRWRWALWAYLAASAMFMANEFIGQSTVFTVRHLRVDVTGSPVNNPDPAGFLAHAVRVTGVALLVIVALWVCFVARQAVSYRRATGERRQQLKWLMCGGALCVAGIVVTIQAGNYSGASLAARVVLAAGVLAIVALPVSIGVAILKYRLYDIDRIISRTLAYAIVTGLLIGVYAGLVLLATQVLSFHTPVAVAASTLAAVALFSPLRRRVQRAVDRRFNRARYDADQTIAAFAARLKDNVDLAAVRDDLAGVVSDALEPVHVSVWVSQRGRVRPCLTIGSPHMPDRGLDPRTPIIVGVGQASEMPGQLWLRGRQRRHAQQVLGRGLLHHPRAVAARPQRRAAGQAGRRAGGAAVPARGRLGDRRELHRGPRPGRRPRRFVVGRSTPVAAGSPPAPGTAMRTCWRCSAVSSRSGSACSCARPGWSTR